MNTYKITIEPAPMEPYYEYQVADNSTGEVCGSVGATFDGDWEWTGDWAATLPDGEWLGTFAFLGDAAEALHKEWWELSAK